MKGEVLHLLEEELRNFAQNSERSIRSFFKIIKLLGKALRKFLRPVKLVRYHAPGEFEEVENWAYNVRNSLGPPEI